MIVQLHHGDCLDFMAQMADNSVDAVITDPPYGVNLAYGSGFDDSPARWLELVPPIVTWALTRGILCVLFGAAPTQARDLTAFPEKPQRTLIWSPTFSLSKSRANGMFYRWHPVYCWNLPKKHEGPSMDILRIPCDGHNWWNHPGTKPMALMRALVQIARVGATVFDPFMGSGTTGVACAQTGRNFIGCEIDAGYFAIAEQRIAEARLQPRLGLEPETAVVQPVLGGLA